MRLHNHEPMLHGSTNWRNITHWLTNISTGTLQKLFMTRQRSSRTSVTQYICSVFEILLSEKTAILWSLLIFHSCEVLIEKGPSIISAKTSSPPSTPMNCWKRQYICHRINFGLTWPGNQGRHKLSSAHFGHLYKSSEHAFFLTNALYLDASYFNMDYVTHTSGLLAMLKCLSCELARALWPQPFIPVKANGISDLSLYPDTIRMFFCCQCSILCLILELNIFKGQLQYC